MMMQKNLMRIAVWYNVPAGGAKRALHDHVVGLIARGHTVEAWCPPTADRSLFPLAQIVPEHVVPLDVLRPPWWEPGRVASIRSPRRTMRSLEDHCVSCAKEINGGRFDLSFVATCQAFGAPPLAQHLRRARVLYLQEPQRWLYEANPVFPWLAPRQPRGARERLEYPGRVVLESLRAHRRGQRARFELENAQAFDALLVNSNFSREAVLKAYGLDSTVCYLGVDTEVFRPTGAERERMLLGVGQLATQKRAQLLVEAVAQMPSPRPRVEWVGAGGDESHLSALRAAAASNSVDLRIHLRADDRALVSAMNRAQALVYTPRLEPFGLVPLEANACELPVIGVAEGGVRETVVDGVNGLVIRPNAENLAEAIGRLLGNPELRDRLGREGRRIVAEQWTREHAAVRLEAELARVLDGAC